MDVSAIALRGLENAQANLEKTARRLASAGVPSAEAPPVDQVDLSAEMVALLAARNDFGANLQSLKTSDEMKRHTLDILA